MGLLTYLLFKCVGFSFKGTRRVLGRIVMVQAGSGTAITTSQISSNTLLGATIFRSPGSMIRSHQIDMRVSPYDMCLIFTSRPLDVCKRRWFPCSNLVTI